MPHRSINPPELFPSEQYGFSQIAVSRGGTTVYISGQVAWDAQKDVGDRGDLAVQTRRAFENLRTALHAAGATLADVVSLRIYLVGEHIHRGAPVSAALREFFQPHNLPTSTWIGVAALANPDFLIEVEAVAVIEA